jgi:hypothetical protein
VYKTGVRISRGAGRRARHNHGRHRRLRSRDRAVREPISDRQKFRKIGQIFLNLKTGTALRSREYYSFPDRRYTSTVACASHPRLREKFPAAAKNAAKARKVNIVDTS